ncbi:MAG TPA: hypothetical protein VF143_00030 [Candidatus Nanopelagicales bacterium]
MAEPIPLSRNAAACDHRSCDTWSREPEAHGFLEVVWGPQRLLFCGVDCLLTELAMRTEPTSALQL